MLDQTTTSIKKVADILVLLRRELNDLLGDRVKAIYLYGSQARADAQPDSDVDVFIELSELTPELRLQIREVAWKIGYEQGIVISTLVATTQSITNGPMAANPIMKVIRDEGIAL